MSNIFLKFFFITRYTSAGYKTRYPLRFLCNQNRVPLREPHRHGTGQNRVPPLPPLPSDSDSTGNRHSDSTGKTGTPSRIHRIAPLCPVRG